VDGLQASGGETRDSSTVMTRRGLGGKTVQEEDDPEGEEEGHEHLWPHGG
jgi:hypothetical protein